jgi:hypothetical protein
MPKTERSYRMGGGAVAATASAEARHWLGISGPTMRPSAVDARRVASETMPAERKPASKRTKATKPKTPTMPEAGAKTVARFDRLAETFVARGATRSQMFGMPVLKAGDKVFAGTFGDAMTFKLGPDDLEQARALAGVESFEPMRGRPMKEWVLVPLAHAKRWSNLAERAFTYLS